MVARSLARSLVRWVCWRSLRWSCCLADLQLLASSALGVASAFATLVWPSMIALHAPCPASHELSIMLRVQQFIITIGTFIGLLFANNARLRRLGAGAAKGGGASKPGSEVREPLVCRAASSRPRCNMTWGAYIRVSACFRLPACLPAACLPACLSACLPGCGISYMDMMCCA